ncbi:MAG: hypothetical protein AAFO07_10905 [Bacteroidota bacterium]
MKTHLKQNNDSKASAHVNVRNNDTKESIAGLSFPAPDLAMNISQIVAPIQRVSTEELTTTSFGADDLASNTDDDLVNFYFILDEYKETLSPSDAEYQQISNKIFTVRAEISNRQITNAGADVNLRQSISAELIDYTRALIDVYPTKITDFAHQADLGTAEKVRIVGAVAAAVANMEVLLGTIHYDGGDWEPPSTSDTQGSGTYGNNRNRGYMVDNYTGKSGNQSGIDWCSRFATTALASISGNNSLLASSGYKIANPGEFDGIDIDYDNAQGGAFVGTNRSRNANANSASGNYNTWANLRQTLSNIDNGTDTSQTKNQVVDNFFSTEIQPQAGDIVILRRGSANQNSFSNDDPDTSSNEAFQSHTTMVDRLEGRTIHIIEGNHGNRAQQTRSFDLTDPSDVEEIVYIARPSLTNYMGNSSYESTTSYTEADLLDPINHINTQLERMI